MHDSGTVLQQALFGYDDGHRLLESSARLTPLELEKLLILTDLAPGLSSLREDGYWTGYPLSETYRYALSRTWPAPEMSRPGCVWTHVIFVPFSALTEAWDLTTLSILFKRPSLPDYRDYYCVNVLSRLLTDTPARGPKANECLAFNLAESVYLRTENVYLQNRVGKPVVSQDCLGTQALALWSQQWPALRCSFSFRTIGKGSSIKTPLLNFDLGISDGLLRFRHELTVYPIRPSLVNVAEWLGDLEDDLRKPQPTSLRKFVRTYGEDFTKEATWIPFLAIIRRLVLTNPAGGEHVNFLLEQLAEALPAQEDGLHLKTDLISFDSKSIISLPESAFQDVLAFMLLNPRARSFPELSFSSYRLVKRLWDTSPQRLLQLVRTALKSESPSIVALLNALCKVTTRALLMTATREWSDVQIALVRHDASLLDWDGLANVQRLELIPLLDTLDAETAVRCGVVPRLLSTTSYDVAVYICKRFPGEALREICVGRGNLHDKLRVHEYFLQWAGEVAPRYLYETFLRRLPSTSALYAFASILGFINGHTTAAGPLPWARSLKFAEEDLNNRDLECFKAFLLALGLARPQQGAEDAFEYSFEPLHRTLSKSSLPYQASVMLDKQLPELSWWRNWDKCLRLRMAVVDAYARACLSPSSFLKLTKDRHLSNQLFEILDSDSNVLAYRDKVRAARAPDCAN